MRNNVKIKLVGVRSDIRLITIRGVLDSMTAYPLQDRVEALIEEGDRKYLIDLEEVEHISSAGVGFFSAVILKLQRHHGKVLFVNIPPQVYEVLELTRLIEIFTVVKSLEEGIATLEAMDVTK